MTNQKLCTKKGIECRQRTSANANIFTEHKEFYHIFTEQIEFYRMVSRELRGGAAPPDPYVHDGIAHNGCVNSYKYNTFNY